MTSDIKLYVVTAISPDRSCGQDLAVDAVNDRGALDAFHEATGYSMVDWTVEVIEAIADPTEEISL